MRLVKTSSLSGHEVLARSVLDIHGKKMLSAGFPLKQSYINKLLSMGITSIYIADEISNDIIIESYLTPETHMAAKQMIAEQMDLFKKKEQLEAQKIGVIVDRIIREVIMHPFALLNFRDIRMQDEYTISHSVNVCILSLMLATRSGLPQDTVRNIGIGAIIHDFGKVMVPDDIINKKDKLTADEFVEIKKHPVHLYNIIKDNTAFSPISKVTALMHHEHMDGTGYPLGINGEKIHYSARICAICDVFDAMTSDNLYHSSQNVADAIEFLQSNIHTRFDSEFVENFNRYIPIYPNGTIVELSNNTIGIVLENTSKNILRPKVRVLYDKTVKKQVTPFYEMDLLESLSVTIIREVTEPIQQYLV